MTDPIPAGERQALEEATVLDALRAAAPGEGLDTMTLLQATGLNSGALNPALGRLVAAGKVDDWWTDGNPRVRMYRLREGQ